MFASLDPARSALASTLTAPFARIDDELAGSLLEQHYGWRPRSLRRLATERDDTFRVSTPHGDVVAKFAHPDDPASELADQVTVLERLETEHPELPVQRLVRGLDGHSLHEVRDPEGRSRRLRVLRFVEGEALGVAHRDDAALHSLGGLHARLARAIAGVGASASSTHPLRGATTAWNLLTAAELPPLLPTINDPEVRGRVARILDDALEHTVPAAATLPPQLAHNDLHGDNVLVSATPFTVLGVLDFGDMCRTPRVADLAVALSYSRGYRAPGNAEHPWAAARAQLAGLEAEHPLTDDERRLLPRLVLLRLAQRAVLNSAIAAANESTISRNGTADYARRNLGRLAIDLHDLAETAPDTLGGTA